jgi:tetratricopeptide (TPR) repeat protein
MKADEQKAIETNSLAQSLAKVKEQTSSKTLYLIGGAVALVFAGILAWNYFAADRARGRDVKIIELETADTAKKLDDYIKQYEGTPLGNIAKMHLGRRSLGPEGLEKLGTNDKEARRQAVASIEQARKLFLELAEKWKDEPALTQETWFNAALAEETLVGMPTTDGGTDSRGSLDKAIEYYKKAAAIFPESDASKRYLKLAEEREKNKDGFLAAQKAFYKERELPVLPPLPKFPEIIDPLKKDEPKPDVKKEPEAKKEPEVKKEPEAKKEPEKAK